MNKLRLKAWVLVAGGIIAGCALSMPSSVLKKYSSSHEPSAGLSQLGNRQSSKPAMYSPSAQSLAPFQFKAPPDVRPVVLALFRSTIQVTFRTSS